MLPCTICGIHTYLLRNKAPLEYTHTNIPLQATYATLHLDHAVTNELMNL